MLRSAKTIKAALLSLLFVASPHAFAGGEGISGGGTDLRFDFQQSARKALAEIPTIPKLAKLPVAQLTEVLESAQIVFTNEKLYVKEGGIKQEVAAINYPDKKRIVINRKKWKDIESNAKREALVLHELLSLIGLEKTGVYQYSQFYYDANASRAHVRYNDVMKPQALNKNEAPTITIVVYEDFISPYVAVNNPILQEVIKKFGDSVQVVVRNFPLTLLHKNSELAALAGICANNQNRFAELRQKFMDEYRTDQIKDWSEDRMNKAQIRKLALSVPGLNVSAMEKCMESPEAQVKLDADLRNVNELKIMGTPTMIVSSYNHSRRILGAQPYENLEKLLNKMLKSNDSTDSIEEPSSVPSESAN